MIPPPLVTIIVPTFNSESYIGNCLSSLKGQTFTDFNVLIQDAMSTDKTIAIVNTYKNDLNILVTSERDSGIYNAMNIAKVHATGKYTLFLGSDDSLYSRNTLQKVAKILNEKAPDLLWGDVYLKEQEILKKQNFTTSTLYKNVICHQSIFYKTKTLNKLKYNECFSIFADQQLTREIFFKLKGTYCYTDIPISIFSTKGASSSMRDFCFAMQVHAINKSFFGENTEVKRHSNSLVYQCILHLKQNGAYHKMVKLIFHLWITNKKPVYLRSILKIFFTRSRIDENR